MNVQRPSADALSIEVAEGEALYVLGANGSGKSTLLFNWGKQDKTSNLISGNRDISFTSAAVTTSAEQSSQQEAQARNQIDHGATARFSRQNHNNANWLNGLIFKLKSRGDYQNAEYVKADQEGREDDKVRAYSDMPIKLLNSAFVSANLPISLNWDDKSKLNVKKEGIEGEYGFNEMSDGERSAFIIAASAILAMQATTIFLDEPERHLHRSISSPLLSYLRQIRPDLKWVISTHDLSLPRYDQEAQILIVYAFDGSNWQADKIDNISSLDPLVAEAIYGAREKVIFVEGGAEASLDLPLYKLFFAGTTIVPCGTCKDVRNSVVSLNNSSGLHHMVAGGIVDSDNRHDLSSLQADGIAALGVYAIESVYYHPTVIDAVLQVAGVTVALSDVLAAACASISDDNIEALAKDAVYKSFRQEFESKRLSSSELLEQTSDFQLTFDDPTAKLQELKEDLRALKDSGNWEGLIQKMKIKSTPSTGRVAGTLGYKGTKEYEIAVRKLLAKDDALRQNLGAVIPNPFSGPAGDAPQARRIPVRRPAEHQT
ncbi:hypothetical protein A8B82_10790 [Sulfitobacter sp. EhC04]|nr:hypothetical protein A8B82_10790 [Sulfitobacter sp. EhC04]